MSKYRLIKKYPGSPELGTIAEKAGDIKYTHPDGRESFTSSSAECLFEKIVENQPEFWEKIVEKDYEILSVIIRSYNQICKKEGYYFVPKLGGIKPFILDSHIDYKIHSVKRLSDSEI